MSSGECKSSSSSQNGNWDENKFGNEVVLKGLSESASRGYKNLSKLAQNTFEV
jgi:hypothetical protein